MSSTMKTPMYIPSCYAFSGLQPHELPFLAQHYLVNVLHIDSPSSSSWSETLDPDVILEKRTQLVMALYRSLQGVDMAMIEKVLETRAIRDQLNACGTALQRHHTTSSVTICKAHELDEARLQEIVGVLLPERQTLLDEFVTKFDTLMWLEFEGVYFDEDDASDTTTATTLEWHQATRNSRLEPIIAYTDLALINLHDAVIQKASSKEATISPREDTHSLSTNVQGGTTSLTVGRMLEDISNTSPPKYKAPFRRGIRKEIRANMTIVKGQ